MILGIDPSICGTGLVHLNEYGDIIKQTLIKSDIKPVDPIDDLNRLNDICSKIGRRLDCVELVVMEGLAFMATKTTSLCQLSALNYFIRDRINNRGIKFLIVPPTQLKKFITGKGNCKKELMLLETFKRYELSFTNNNICDAYGLAKIGHAYLYGHDDLPIFQKEVITQLSSIYDGRKRENVKTI
jgi:crossover junction endodeoxyribonuclease RuvC